MSALSAPSLPPGLSAKLDELRRAHSNLETRRRTAWETLDGCERSMLCRAGFLDPALADLRWCDMPEDAREEIGIAARVMSSLVAKIRTKGAV